MSSMYKQKPSSHASKLSSQQYTHLTVKQIMQSMDSFDMDYYTPIQSHLLPMTKQANKISLIMNSPHQKQQMIHSLVQNIRENDGEFQRLKAYIKEQMSEKALNISEMESRKNTFSIDCLKQVMSYPFKKDREQMMHNFVAFWRLSLDKELRRVLWQKSLVSQSTKRQFFRWDHQITPYNIELEFRISIDRIVQSQGVKLKQLQKDIAIKLLEYTVKKTQNLPNRSQLYLVINLVELFSYFNLSRINQLGAVYVGLEQLSRYYYQPRVEQRVEKILKALQLVDEASFLLLNTYFFTNQDRQALARVELNEVYEHFRLSLGARYLPFGVSQFFIDQLLIKKRNTFDCYVLFAIVILVMGDHLEKLLQGQKEGSIEGDEGQAGGEQSLNQQSGTNLDSMESLSPIKPSPYNKNSPQKGQSSSLIKMKKVGAQQFTKEITIKSLFENSKKLIKKQDVIEAFNVVYEKIPATYSKDYELSEPNLLFSYLLNEQKLLEEDNKFGREERVGLESSQQNRMKQNGQQDEEEMFLMEQLEMLQQKTTDIDEFVIVKPDMDNNKSNKRK